MGADNTENMRRAQAAMEFVILTAIMLTFFAAAFAVTQSIYVDVQEERIEQQAYEFFSVLEAEFLVAQRIGPGYERFIRIPLTFSGIDYTIETNWNETPEGKDAMMLEIRGEEFLYFLDPPVNGTIEKGWHLVTGGEEVQIQPSIGPTDDCMHPDGTYIVHGDNRTYYRKAQAENIDETCADLSTVLICNDGKLEDEDPYVYNESSCEEYVPKQCPLPNGTMVDHLWNGTFYLESSPDADFCESELRECFDGTLNGSYEATTCDVGCELPDGSFVSDGWSGTYYLNSTPAAGSCTSETRVCDAGTLTGSYEETSCAPGCELPDGSFVSDGWSGIFYEESAPASGTCVDETRTCTSGTLSGSYEATTCDVGCELPDGSFVSDGWSGTFFADSSPSSGSCQSETRTCSAGTLSGSYQETTCDAACQLPDGAWLEHGQSTTYYSTDEAPPGESCSSYSDTYTCTSGTLSGANEDEYVHAICTGYSGAYATGGSIVEKEIGGITYRIHTFLSTNDFTVVESGDMDYLVVAGGGGGGNGDDNEGAGGGGGAGGLLTGTKNVDTGTYTVSVGAGGAGGACTPRCGGLNGQGSDGQDSSFDGIVATGGGGGGGEDGGYGWGRDGGSGGGSGSSQDPGSGISDQGHDGARGIDGGPDSYGGGGGGAGSAGGGGTGNSDGGSGRSVAITGSSVTYAIGGDGGLMLGTNPGDDGRLYRGDGGDGGDGGGGSSNYPGGDGGSGIVIIRYPIG